MTQRFDERHALKLEGRYSKGKIQYIGADNERDQGYGSLKSDHLPRKAYDIRALYEYTHPLSENIKAKLEGGLGYRVLKDLSTRKDPSDYDRTNKTLYAQIGTGLNVALPHSFSFEPKISYNHMIRGRQYTYLDPSFYNKQHGGKGIEIELPLSKTLSNRSKVSLAPFYLGWKVPDSDDIAYVDENGEEGILREPKNYTHEAGVRLKYTF